MQNSQIITIAIIIIVMGIRLWRTAKTRPINMARLFIMPAIISLLIATSLYFMPHPQASMMTILIMSGAIIVGIILGYARAHTLKLWWDADQNKVISQTSRLAIVFIIALIAAKSLMRQTIGANPQAAIVVDSMMLFGASMILANAITIWIRARRIIAVNAPSR